MFFAIPLWVLEWWFLLLWGCSNNWWSFQIYVNNCRMGCCDPIDRPAALLFLPFPPPPPTAGGGGEFFTTFCKKTRPAALLLLLLFIPERKLNMSLCSIWACKKTSQMQGIPFQHQKSFILLLPFGHSSTTLWYFSKASEGKWWRFLLRWSVSKLKGFFSDGWLSW